MLSSRAMDPSQCSLERLVPDALDACDATGAATLELHLDRYRFAARHLQPGRVLDLACGVGYGTRFLAERANAETRLVGVDVSAEAVDYARRHYDASNIEFVVSDAAAFEDPQGFETIVCLETVEHVEDPAALVAHLVGLLRPGGVLVASVPTTPSVDVNPHHRHDFSERSFRKLVACHRLREFDRLRQVQPVAPGSVLRRSEARMRDVRPNLLAWYAANPSSFCRRVAATVRYGFANRYLTLAWRAESTA
jgi:SAM-dependent methyltransferase